MGYTYVKLDGNVVNNGVSLLNGTGGGGDTGVTMRLGWEAGDGTSHSGGFTGTGWNKAWDSLNVTLKDAWTSVSPGPAQGYENTFESFLKYVQTNPENLNPWLDNAGWTNEMKKNFMLEVNINLESNCLIW